MTATGRPGDLLSRSGGATWRVYRLDGADLAAAYVDGGLLRQDRDGWWRAGPRGERQPVESHLVVEAAAAIPEGWELHPEQAELVRVPTAEKVGGGATPELIGRSAAAVEPSRPEWLWRGWLPAGTLSLLIGRQGSGKTTWAASVAAHLSRGRPLPGAEQRPPIKVGVMSLEEPGDRVVARLGAADADLDRITVLDGVRCPGDGGTSYLRPWRMPADTGLLQTRIVADGLGLVVIDGIGYAVTSGSGEPGYSVVGAALSALAAVAADTGCAVLGLTHPPKGTSDPTTAAIGSTGWTAIPRVTWVLGRHPDDDERRVVKVAKTNYAEPETGWAWRIGSDPEWEVGYVSGAQPSDVAAAALTAAPATADERSERDGAAHWLSDLLGAGPMPYREVERAAREAGIARATLHRAKSSAGVEVERDEHAQGRPTVWRLSSQPRETKPGGTKPKPPVTCDNTGAEGVSSQAGARGTKPQTAAPCDRCHRVAEYLVPHHLTGDHWCSACCQNAAGR